MSGRAIPLALNTVGLNCHMGRALQMKSFQQYRGIGSAPIAKESYVCTSTTDQKTLGHAEDFQL